MPSYKFEKSRIENHVEKIGVDVRPIIEVRGERTKLADYGMWLTDRWPALYENIVQGPTSFLITKNLVFPGKGQLAHPTFDFAIQEDHFIGGVVIPNVVWDFLVMPSQFSGSGVQGHDAGGVQVHVFALVGTGDSLGVVKVAARVSRAQ